MSSIRDNLESATRRLETAGIASARAAAEVLLRHVLGQPRAFLYSHDDQELTAEQQQRYDLLIASRGEGVPVQYLTGWQEFYRRQFRVTPVVLIPRPETELVVEAALELIKQDCSPLVVDVGTGSGSIAVTIALERRDARVLATELSRDALHVAEENATRLGAAVDFITGDLLEPLLERRLQFDLVVANPPYVGENELAGLQREVRDFEPHVALVGGATGVEVYSRLVPQAHIVLQRGGWLVLEIGYSAGQRVRELLREGWTGVEIRPDLQGFDRVLIARKT